MKQNLEGGSNSDEYLKAQEVLRKALEGMSPEELEKLKQEELKNDPAENTADLKGTPAQKEELLKKRKRSRLQTLKLIWNIEARRAKKLKNKLTNKVSDLMTGKEKGEVIIGQIHEKVSELFGGMDRLIARNENENDPTMTELRNKRIAAIKEEILKITEKEGGNEPRIIALRNEKYQPKPTAKKQEEVKQVPDEQPKPAIILGPSTNKEADTATFATTVEAVNPTSVQEEAVVPSEVLAIINEKPAEPAAVTEAIELKYETVENAAEIRDEEIKNANEALEKAKEEHAQKLAEAEKLVTEKQTLLDGTKHENKRQIETRTEALNKAKESLKKIKGDGISVAIAIHENAIAAANEKYTNTARVATEIVEMEKEDTPKSKEVSTTPKAPTPEKKQSIKEMEAKLHSMQRLLAELPPDSDAAKSHQEKISSLQAKMDEAIAKQTKKEDQINTVKEKLIQIMGAASEKETPKSNESVPNSSEPKKEDDKKEGEKKEEPKKEDPVATKMEGDLKQMEAQLAELQERLLKTHVPVLQEKIQKEIDALKIEIAKIKPAVEAAKKEEKKGTEDNKENNNEHRVSPEMSLMTPEDIAIVAQDRMKKLNEFEKENPTDPKEKIQNTEESRNDLKEFMEICEGKGTGNLAKQIPGLIPGFDKLPDGQKMMIIQGLDDSLLKHVKQNAIEKFQQKVAGKSGFGKFWTNMFKNYHIKRSQKMELALITGKDYKRKLWWNKKIDRSQSKVARANFINKNVPGLMEVFGNSGIDAYLEDGKVINDFSNRKLLAKQSPELQEIGSRYNTLANKLSHTPIADKKAYEKAKAEFNTVRDEFLLGLKEKIGKKEAAETVKRSGILIDSMSFLAADQDTSKRLVQIASSPAALQTLKQVMTERGLMMGAGAGARITWKAALVWGGVMVAGAPVSLTAAIGVAAGSGIISGVVGYYRGKSRAGKQLEDDKALMRRGQKVGTAGYETKGTDKNGDPKVVGKGLSVVAMTSITKNIKRIDDIRAELQNTTNPPTEIRRNELLARLKTVADFAEAKSERNEINFGKNDSEVFVNQNKLMNAIHEARALMEVEDNEDKIMNMFDPESSGAELGGADAAFRRRLVGFGGLRAKHIEKEEEKYKRARGKKSAFFGAIAGSAGAAVAHAAEHYGWFHHAPHETSVDNTVPKPNETGTFDPSDPLGLKKYLVNPDTTNTHPKGWHPPMSDNNNPADPNGAHDELVPKKIHHPGGPHRAPKPTTNNTPDKPIILNDITDKPAPKVTPDTPPINEQPITLDPSNQTLAQKLAWANEQQAQKIINETPITPTAPVVPVAPTISSTLEAGHTYTPQEILNHNFNADEQLVIQKLYESRHTADMHKFFEGHHARWLGKDAEHLADRNESGVWNPTKRELDEMMSNFENETGVTPEGRNVNEFMEFIEKYEAKKDFMSGNYDTKNIVDWNTGANVAKNVTQPTAPINTVTNHVENTPTSDHIIPDTPPTKEAITLNTSDHAENITGIENPAVPHTFDNTTIGWYQNQLKTFIMGGEDSRVWRRIHDLSAKDFFDRNTGLMGKEAQAYREWLEEQSAFYHVKINDNMTVEDLSKIVAEHRDGTYHLGESAEKVIQNATDQTPTGADEWYDNSLDEYFEGNDKVWNHIQNLQVRDFISNNEDYLYRNGITNEVTNRIDLVMDFRRDIAEYVHENPGSIDRNTTLHDLMKNIAANQKDGSTPLHEMLKPATTAETVRSNVNSEPQPIEFKGTPTTAQQLAFANENQARNIIANSATRAPIVTENPGLANAYELNSIGHSLNQKEMAWQTTHESQLTKDLDIYSRAGEQHLARIISKYGESDYRTIAGKNLDQFLSAPDPANGVSNFYQLLTTLKAANPQYDEANLTVDQFMARVYIGDEMTKYIREHAAGTLGVGNARDNAIDDINDGRYSAIDDINYGREDAIAQTEGDFYRPF